MNFINNSINDCKMKDSTFETSEKLIEIKKCLSHLKKEIDTLDQIIRINRKYAISIELPPTPPAAMKKSKSSDYLQLLSSSSLSLNGNVRSPLSQEVSNLRPESPSTIDQSLYYQSQLADKDAIIKPLNKEDAQKNPILAVACDLKMAASKQRIKDNPIIEIADLIAQKLDELSYYNQVIRSNPKAKKMLIRTAQEMIDKCVSALNYAKKIFETCTDKRLKLQLQNTIERIKTIGQQLKVVVAVKSGGRFDMDGDKQLVICASNLVEAVKGLLNDSEAACLRSDYIKLNGEEEGKKRESDNKNKIENEKNEMEKMEKMEKKEMKKKEKNKKIEHEKIEQEKN